MLRRWIEDKALSIAPVVVALGAWEVASRASWINAVLVPPPTTIIARLWTLVATGSVWEPVAATLGAFFVGYAIATVVGITIGLAMGANDRVFRLFEPLVELLRPIPKPALIPPLFLFLGIGLPTELTIVSLAAVFPIIINTIQGVRQVDLTLIDTARTLRIPRRRLVLFVLLPAALPMIVTGMRVSLGLSLVMVVLTEMLAGGSGLGYLIIDSQRVFAIPEMYAWVFLLAGIGVAMSVLFSQAEEMLVGWRGK